MPSTYRELSPEEQRYYKLLEGLPLIVYSVEPHPPYAPFYVSKGIEALGYTRDEWLDQPDRWLRILHPDDRDWVLAETGRALASGGSLDYVYRVIHRDGTVRWLHDRGSFVPDRHGRVTQWRGVMVDVTEQRVAELALVESENRYRELVDSSPDAILVHAEGRILFANPAAATLFSASAPDLLVGHAVLDLVHPDGRATAAARIRSIAETGRPAVPLVEELLRLDGSTVAAEVNGVAITFRGQPAVQVIARDVSERRRSEQELRQAEDQLRHAQRLEVVGRLAGGIAHDFNNLLTVIMSHLEYARSLVPERSDVVSEMDEAHLAAERAAELTRQLLAFGRRQVFRLERLDLNDVVRGSCQMMRRVVPENIVLSTELHPEPVLVRADRGQLEQVLANLIVNARDAMPDGGALAIRTTVAIPDAVLDPEGEAVPNTTYASISVQDSGFGMDEATAARAFEPFFTTKPVGSGTGLGLSSVHGIVKQSGGFATIRSAVNAGTTVTVSLPVAVRDP